MAPIPKGIALSLVRYILAAIQFSYSFINKIPFLSTLLNKSTAFLAALFNLFSGALSPKGIKGRKLEKPLKLYSFVACPFCRKVDDTISVLGLDCIYYPCPKTNLAKMGSYEGSRYRTEAVAVGGKAQFPLLIDDNNVKVNNEGKKVSTMMYESEEIVKYLWERYGGGVTFEDAPWNYRTARKLMVGNILRNLFRPLNEQGMLKIPSKLPEQMLILWGCEGSPSTIPVREILCSLELPYLYKTVPYYAADKERELADKFGKTANTPVLEDPNAGKVLRGSKAIIDYLKSSYKIGEVLHQSILSLMTSNKKAD